MGRKSAVAIASLIAASIACLLLYAHFIGFERKSLANRFPSDTWAYFSVRHFNKAFLSFVSNDELAAAANIAKAVSFTLGGDFAEEPESEPQVDPGLWDKLGKAIKTQVALAALDPPEDSAKLPELALVAYLYISPQTFQDTVEAIANQASNASVTYSWIQEKTGNTSYFVLKTVGAASSKTPSLSWAAYEDVLFIGSSPQVVRRLLRHQTNPQASTLADRIASHNPVDRIEKADITLYVDAKKSLELASERLTSKLKAMGGFYSSVSTDAFFRALGLYEFDSFLAQQKLSGDQDSYASLTFEASPPLLNALSHGDHSLHQQYPEYALLASNSYRLDLGTLLETVRDSSFAAAPLSRFAYMGLQANVLSETGEPLDEIVANAFENHIATLHTLDIGTSKTLAGDIRHELVFDFAAKIQLSENAAPLLALIQPRIRAFIEANPRQAYREGSTLYIDRFADKSLTAGRFAFDARPDHIAFGFGTLKSFNTLISREEVYPVIQDTISSAEAVAVGDGVLLLEALPSTLFEIATVFFEQTNPGTPIPDEFLEFDWTTLSALEQERHSRIYFDRSGQLYRVSKKRR